MEKHGYTPEEPSYMLVECGYMGKGCVYIDAMILMANLLRWRTHSTQTKISEKFSKVLISCLKFLTSTNFSPIPLS